MNTPGFTAEYSLFGPYHQRPSGVARVVFSRKPEVSPSLVATGGWEDCVAGCKGDDGTFNSNCMSACDLFAGWPSFPSGNGGGGGTPSCWPGFGGSFRFGNKTCREYTSHDCSRKLVCTLL